MAISFLKQLAALAKVTGRELPEAAFELFDVFVLQSHGEAACTAALGEFIRTNARGFPTPGELVALIEGPKLSPKQQASEIAARMIGMIARRGYTWPDTCRYDGYQTFEDAIGDEIGNEAVPVVNACGGWARFCQQFDEGANGNARAQLRDLVEAQIVRSTPGIKHRLEAPKGQGMQRIGDVMRGALPPASAKESIDAVVSAIAAETPRCVKRSDVC